MSTTTPRPTPETDAHIKELQHNPEISGCNQTLNFARKLERERDEARDQLERWQMRLVACDVVAMSDTESSRGPARDIHKNYWSAAVESVIRRVDECIELRKQLEDMREAIKEAIDSLHKCSRVIGAPKTYDWADEDVCDAAYNSAQTALAKLQSFFAHE